MTRKTLQEYHSLYLEEVERVSKISIIKMIMYLKLRKINITAYKQIHGKKWIITYKRDTTTFLTNRRAYDYLKPLFERELSLEQREVINRRIKRDDELRLKLSQDRTTNG